MTSTNIGLYRPANKQINLCAPLQGWHDNDLFSLQDPFDVDDMFRENIQGVDAQVLRNVDIEHLLAEITEYIVLELQLREANARDYP